jgi:hypothetical protein
VSLSLLVEKGRIAEGPAFRSRSSRLAASAGAWCIPYRAVFSAAEAALRNRPEAGRHYCYLRQRPSGSRRPEWMASSRMASSRTASSRTSDSTHRTHSSNRTHSSDNPSYSSCHSSRGNYRSRCGIRRSCCGCRRSRPHGSCPPADAPVGESAAVATVVNAARASIDLRVNMIVSCVSEEHDCPSMFRSIGSGRHDRCAGAHKIAHLRRTSRSLDWGAALGRRYPAGQQWPGSRNQLAHTPHSLAVERMCVLAGANRAGYYRHWAASAPRQEETAVCAMRSSAWRAIRKPASASAQ